MTDIIYKITTDKEELAGALSIRRQVFVKEQDVPDEIVTDGRDPEALHIVVKEANRVIGTARIMFTEERCAKLERMAVLKGYRGRGIGKAIVSFFIREMRKRGVKQAVLHAQHQAAGFYKSCGFRETGTPFLEAGIRHLKMVKDL
jgi:predicted GNAT family N-acyltransferase